MKIPKKVKVGSMVYSVEQHAKVDDGEKLLLGRCFFDKAKIILSTDLPDKQNLELTFLHELVHAIAYHFDMKELQENETDIDRIAKGFHMIIVDNPGMFK